MTADDARTFPQVAARHADVRDDHCGATHPRLTVGRGCDEPTGHEGHHVVNDGCGRPEYYWAAP